MKKILLIGGGTWQLPIAKQIKHAGHKLICSNQYENSPCFVLADHGYVIDVLDKESNLRLAQQHCIDAVITDQSDIAVATVAYVAEKMGLPGVGTSLAALFTNKHLMRSHLLDDSFSHPKFALVSNIEQALSFFNAQHAWIISKPLNNQSSRGVNLIRSVEELKHAVHDTLKHSKSECFLVEEYIKGQEITVEGFKSIGGQHKTLAISIKKHLAPNSNVACELEYLPDSKQIDKTKIENAMAYIFAKVPFAITHTEFKIHDGKIYLIEAAIRGGGTKISSHIIPAVSGVNVNELLIKSALGEAVNSPLIETTHSYAMLKFFNFLPGIVTKVISPKKHDWPSEVIDFCLEFSEGDTLTAPCDDRSRHGYVILSSKTREGLHAALNLMESAVHVNTREVYDQKH